MKFSRTEIERLVNDWILNERDRRIVLRRLIDGIKFEPLSEEVGLSVTQVKRIVYRCVQTIQSKCW